MKKYIFISFFLLAIQFTQAQRLSFCKEVDKEGLAIGKDTTFSIYYEDQICFYIVNPRTLNTTKLKYKVYRITNQIETLDFTVEQDIKEDWTWAWKGVYFDYSGTYNVVVYNAKDEKMTSKKLQVYLLD